MTRVTLAGMLLVNMMTTTKDEDVPAKEVWLDRPGIVIQAPHHLSRARAIPVTIDVGADPRTDDALAGFRVGAVSLALVRQDRPGVFLGAAYNPHQIGYPPESFGFGDPPSPESEPSSEHSDPRNILGETIEYQLGGGVVDRGSGRYFLLGGFAKWWAKPQVIHISDPGGPAPAEDRPVPVTASPLGAPWVPPSRPIVEMGELGGRRFLRVKLPPRAPSAHAGKAAKPFFSIVGFHLQNRGGSVGGLFAPQVPADGTAGAMEATVSFASFASFDRARMNRREIPGNWVFLLFYDEQVSEPLNVTLAKTDY